MMPAEIIDLDPELVRALGDQLARFGPWGFALVVIGLICWTIRGRRKG